LLIASYLFYAAWNPPFVLLLWFSTLADWILAKRIQTSVSTSSRRLYLALSLVANLGMLGFFRYTTFAVDNTVALLDLFGIPVQLAAPDIVLPIGISFYTFQTLSYTIDVYRRQAKPWTSFLDYALYVTFFPQLVAGPIVRAFEFLPQCLEPRRATGRELSWGLMLLTVGLFEKVVVADTLLGPIADAVYQPQVVPSTLMAWVGTLAFAGQIFGDFAGYSTCAIGVAMCLGFSLPNNFRFPYASTGFSDFWRRWHVSLSTWLRDYVYISFGGNQIGELRTYINLMLTMLLGQDARAKRWDRCRYDRLSLDAFRIGACGALGRDGNLRSRRHHVGRSLCVAGDLLGKCRCAYSMVAAFRGAGADADGPAHRNRGGS
jgi:alginate O-acetyltransferase complex protein AlgI